MLDVTVCLLHVVCMCFRTLNDMKGYEKYNAITRRPTRNASHFTDGVSTVIS